MLAEWLLSWVIWMYWLLREPLDDRLSRIADSLGFWEKTLPDRLTRKQYLICFVGQIGSGKSTTALKLAEQIGAIVIEGNEIRLKLSAAGLDWKWRVRAVARKAALEALESGFNVIIDSDHLQIWKRAGIRMMARLYRVTPVFVRTLCDQNELLNVRCEGAKKEEFWIRRGAKLGKDPAQLKREAAAKSYHDHYLPRRQGEPDRESPLPRSVNVIRTTRPEAWATQVAALAMRLKQ